MPSSFYAVIRIEADPCICLFHPPEGNLRLSTTSLIPAALRKSRLRTVLLLIALLVFLLILHHRVHFNWSIFLAQLQRASPWHIAAGIACIFAHMWLRSARWTIFLAPIERLPPFSLLNSQFIGFTAVAIFGRLADLSRPYLISRRTNLPLASQIAIYTVERLFDLAAVAILFSTMLFLTPAGDPHHAILAHAGQLALAATLTLAFLTLAIRRAGPRLAATIQSFLSRISPSLADRVAQRILNFSQGLQTLASLPNLLLALALSLALWLLIAAAYLQTVHAFPQTPALAALTFPAIMPLMAASMGGSLLQLPILGWFTQIALTATAMHTLYGASPEDATACATVLLVVNTLCIVPIGVALTRTEHLNLRTIAHASHAGDESSPHTSQDRSFVVRR